MQFQRSMVPMAGSMAAADTGAVAENTHPGPDPLVVGEEEEKEEGSGRKREKRGD